MKNLYLTLMLIFLATNLAFAQEEDAEGCKDHPLFNRMPNYYINECQIKEFDVHNFTIENSDEETAKTETVEGKYYYYTYLLKEGAQEMSEIQIFRNFDNALKKINAKIVGKVVVSGNSYSFICAKIEKGGMETWVRIQASSPEYYITIVEREAMKQYIQANEMLDALNKDGFIALDILFDTGKSTIKAESQPIIDEIFSLLNTNKELKVSIEGHTDNVGKPESNKKLSDDRAKSVMSSLISIGISKDRLSAVGWGQERPVADNRTEEGKAKNRRVEIVKK